MKIKLPRDILLNGIQRVSNIVTPKTTLPILANILMETKSDRVHLVSTDLEITISHTIPATVLEEGGIAIPAKKINDIVRELPEKEITILTQKNNIIIITCEKSFFKILGLPREDFPEPPKTETKNPLILDQGLFGFLLNRTSFAVSHDETRYVLSGTLFVLKNNQLRLVTTDGRRLALIQKTISNPPKIEKQIIIPAKATTELGRTLKEGGEVKIFFSQNQVVFKFNNTTIISRLIEGHFPAYEQIIPKETEQRVRVERERLLGAIRRVSLLSSPTSRVVRLELFKNKILASNQTPDMGEAREELPASYGGEEMVMGFNPGYLTDVLKKIDDNEVILELSGPEKPGVIRVGDDYLYVVMPMQLS